MNFKKNIVYKIIHNESNFCCLCFSIIKNDSVCFHDEVGIGDEPNKIDIKVADILSYLFGNEVFNDMSAINNVCCMTCTLSAVKCYNFINEIKERYNLYVSKVIDNLYNCLDNATHNVDDSKTLFVAINPDTSENNVYYDKSSSYSTNLDAFKAFKFISEIKIPSEGKVFKIKEEKMKPIPSSKLNLTDILYDKTNIKDLRCADCLKTFSNVSNLKSHYLRLHLPKPHNCPNCPKKFTTKSLLRSHLEDCQSSYICMECGKKFNNRNSLTVHEKAHKLRYICEDCGRVYKNHNTFKKHLENNICQMETRHSQADAKFTCDYCQKKYTQKITLRVHIQYEHLNYKQHECKWCKKKFWCQSRLNSHIVKHTKERNFVCKMCDRRFVTKESLLYHTRIHTGEQPYKCPHCDSRFLSISRRTFHIKTQHMNSTVECDICHSKFRSYYYLQKHKKTHIEKSHTVKPNIVTAADHVHNSVNKEFEIYPEVPVKQELIKNEEPEYKVYYAINRQGKLMQQINAEPQESIIEIHPDNDNTEYNYKINDDAQSQNTDENETVYLDMYDDDECDYAVGI